MFSYALACAALSLTGPAQTAEPVKALVYEKVTVSYGDGGLPTATQREIRVANASEMLTRIDSVTGTTIIRASKPNDFIEVWRTGDEEVTRIGLPAPDSDAMDLLGQIPGVDSTILSRVGEVKPSGLGAKLVNGRSCIGTRTSIDGLTFEDWHTQREGAKYLWYAVTKNARGVVTDMTHGVRLEETSDWDRSQFNIPASK